MNSFTFTDAELKAAAAQVREAMLSSLPDPEKCTHEFSDTFKAKMKPLFARAERKQRGRGVIRSIAAIFILLFISMTIWLSVDAEAREAVLNWVRHVYEDRVVYIFDTVAQSGELPEYEVTWIPEGFETIVVYEEEKLAGAVYYNETNGYYIGTQYHYISDATLEEVLLEGEVQAEKVNVNGMEGDYYYDSETNLLVWMDNNSSMVFIIDSQLEKEEIMHIA